MKVFQNLPQISQSNYTRGEFSSLPLSIVGTRKYFVLFNIIGLGSIGFACAACSVARRHSALFWSRRELHPLRAGRRVGNTSRCTPTKKKGKSGYVIAFTHRSFSPPPASRLCSRRVRVLQLHGGCDLRALPGRLLRQRFDWHSSRLSALPLPGPEQLCSNCRDGTGGVHQLPERTDR